MTQWLDLPEMCLHFIYVLYSYFYYITLVLITFLLRKCVLQNLIKCQIYQFVFVVNWLFIFVMWEGFEHVYFLGGGDGGGHILRSLASWYMKKYVIVHRRIFHFTYVYTLSIGYGGWKCIYFYYM